jgi:hypothetical protein
VDGATNGPEIDRSGDADAQLRGDDQQDGGQALGTAEDQPDAAKNEVGLLHTILIPLLIKGWRRRTVL